MAAVGGHDLRFPHAPRTKAMHTITLLLAAPIPIQDARVARISEPKRRNEQLLWYADRKSTRLNFSH